MLASLLDINASFSFIDAYYYWAGSLCPTEFGYGVNECRKASSPHIHVDVLFTYSCILLWVPLNEVSLFVNAGIEFSIHHDVMREREQNKLREPIRSRFMLINCEDNSISQFSALILFCRFCSLRSSTLQVTRINSSFRIWFLSNVRQHSFSAVTRQADSQCNFPDRAILVVYGKHVSCNILVHRQLFHCLN